MNRNEFINPLNKYANRVQQFRWEDIDCYASWLSQTFHFVSHSTRLIALAASRFYKDKSQLHQRFLEHISEEEFHENLASRDVKALGLELSAFPELSVTKVFYRSQYYQIEREAPESFLGYILALEGIAVLAGDNANNRVCETFGPKAASFLRVHSQEDKEHIESAFKHILSLDDKNQKMAYANFIQSGEMYCKILDAIEENYLTANKKMTA